MIDRLEVPTDLISPEKFAALSSQEKEAELRGILAKTLSLNQNGLTVPMVSKSLESYSSRPTIWRHLENMVASREAYKLEFGKQLVVYYPNGKLMHPLFQEDLIIGESRYGFYFLKNELGEFLYVQEKKENRLGLASVCGGILIPYKGIAKFTSKLSELKREVENHVQNG